LDVALQGTNATKWNVLLNQQENQANLFRNINKGTAFVAVPAANADFRSRHTGTFTFADYNADGWLDLLSTGEDYLAQYRPALYTNHEGANFTLKLIDVEKGAIFSTGEWGDYDNDGYPDFCYYGYFALYVVPNITNPTFSFTGGIYKNAQGSGTFNLAQTLNGTEGEGVACVWGDYNNDGRLDVFLIGYNIPNGAVFTNTGATPSEPPSPPTGATHRYATYCKTTFDYHFRCSDSCYLVVDVKTINCEWNGNGHQMVKAL